MGRSAIGMIAAVVVAVAAVAGCGRDGASPEGASPAAPAPPVTAPAAPQSLQPLHRYPEVTVDLSAAAPVTVEVPGTTGLADQLAGDRRIEVIVSFGPVDPAAIPDFPIVVFVNSPDAGPDTPASEPGFVGTASFTAGQDPDRPARSALPARTAITHTLAGPGPLTVTLVPSPFSDRTTSPRAYPLAVALLLVVAAGD